MKTITVASTFSSLLLAAQVLAAEQTSRPILVEAEGFTDRGGWTVDQQAMDVMGSPYLLAHGLGTPVADAVMKIKVAVSGE
ncbi:MAG: pyridine nucleotide-disulfide oxidoreductase, partial [Verrucomicrobiia bacterium]